MADLERDLERLLAGDQNVGLVPRATGAGPAGDRAPKRWPLLLAGGLVLVGLAVYLVLPAPPPPVSAPAAVPAPVVTPPPAPTPPPAVTPPPAAAVVPSPPPSVAAARKKRVRAEQPATKPATPPATGPAGKSREAHVPLGSKEAYPDK